MNRGLRSNAKVDTGEEQPAARADGPPNEVIVLISFEISMGEMRGIINLCIPFNTIEPLTGKLSANTWSTYTQKQPDRRQVLNLETSVSSAGVEMIVYLASSRLTAGEVMGLAGRADVAPENNCQQPL